MKRRLTKLDENAHWWAKTKTDWAIQDKDGNWWIIPGSEFPETKVDKNVRLKREQKKQSSARTELRLIVLTMLASALGISLAIVIFYFLIL
jgi:hypothetical protein